MERPYALVRLDDLQEAEEVGGVRFKPLRRALGIEAFGVNAWLAEAGQELIAEHAEEDDEGQEELYAVVSGGVEFLIDGEPVRAGAGTFVAVRAGARRSARAAGGPAVLLAVGAPRGRAFRATGWEYGADAVPAYRRGDYGRAADIQHAALERHPGSANLLYNLACCESLAGRRDEALAHLAEAVELLPRLRPHAQTDADLDPIRDDPRFPAPASP